MNHKKMFAVFVLFCMAIAGCGPSKSEKATIAAQTQAALDNLATEVAGTQQARQATEDASNITATAEFHERATEMRRTEMAATNSAATAEAYEAEIVTQTQAAASMYDQIVELQAYGYISDLNGTFYAYPDYNKSWAQINYYTWQRTYISPTDFVIRVDASWDSASETANLFNSGCGFVFREREVDNHYLVYLGLDGNVYFDRVLRGNWKQLGRSWYGAVGYPQGEAQLMLVVEGDTFTFFVNGERVRTQVDNQLERGELGLTLVSGTNKGYGTRCTMKNIEIWVMR